MIKHLVMIRLKEQDPEIRIKHAHALKNAIDGLMGRVPELKSMEVGLNLSTKASAYDIVLTSEFETMESLDVYRVHPEHQKVVELLHKVMEQTAVVDYEV